MTEILIVGASGFGREVAWLIEELKEWKVVGFIDDSEEIQNTIINGIPVIGKLDFLEKVTKKTYVTIAIGNPIIRKKISERLMENKNIVFPNIIAKDIRINRTIKLGIGNIICTNNILTTNISIGNFNHVNLSCTIGHDVVFNNYVTVYPGVNISGNVEISDISEIGTGSKIIQGKHISSNVIIGAGSVIVKNIEEEGTYVGVPARRVKK